jgi:peptide/nickel transport system permease protein
MAPSTLASAPADGAAAAADTVAGRRRIPWLPVLGLGFLLVLIAVAGAAPLIAPQDPTRQSLRARLVGPTLEAADGRSHLLGTDHLGRDVLSRVIYGARVSLIVVCGGAGGGWGRPWGRRGIPPAGSTP